VLESGLNNSVLHNSVAQRTFPINIVTTIGQMDN